MANPLTPKTVPEDDILRKIKEVVDFNGSLLIVQTEETDTGFDLITEGGDRIPVDLSGKFLTRDEYHQSEAIAPANESKSGRIAIADQTEAEAGEDDTKAMTPLKTVALLDKRGVPRFNLDGYSPGQLLSIAKEGDDLIIKPIAPCEAVKNCSNGTGNSGGAVGLTDENLEYIREWLASKEGWVNNATGSDASQPTAPTTGDTGTGTTGGDAITYVWDNFSHFELVADESTPTTPAQPSHDYRGSLDENNCQKLTGWVADRANPNVPVRARITKDGQFYKYVTAQGNRPDVKDALTQAGISGITSTIFGFECLKSADDSDGKNHEWRVFVEDSTVEVYYVPQVAKAITCAAPVVNTVYVQYLVIRFDTDPNVTKGSGSLKATLYEHLSDESERIYASGGIPQWSADVSGITITPAANGITASVSADNSVSVSAFRLKATATGGSNNQPVNVIAASANRPSGLTTYKSAWNFSPVGGYTRQFDSLDDALTTAGKSFDGTGPGALGPPDRIQCADLNIGTTVYLGIDNDDKKAGNGLLYLLDANGGNTVKKAIQVTDGKISNVKSSTYVTPTQTASVAAVAIWRRDADTLVLLYKSNPASDQQLEDCWTEFFTGYGAQPAYVPTYYLGDQSTYNPSGYQDFKYLSGYGGKASDLNLLKSTCHFHIRKQGATDDKLSFTFTAANLAVGEIRTIYSA